MLKKPQTNNYKQHHKTKPLLTYRIHCKSNVNFQNSYSPQYQKVLVNIVEVLYLKHKWEKEQGI